MDWQSVIKRYRSLFSLTADTRDTASGWTAATSRPFNTNPRQQEQLYASALEAWRLNPYAKRIIDVITDFCIGDGIVPTAPGEIGRFIDRFWHHPKNQIDIRLPDIIDELSRAGELFVVLFTNYLDGMSYLRLIPASEITDIETLANDWETPIAFTQRPAQPGGQPIIWLSPEHPNAVGDTPIMLHFTINKPVGALRGEGELNTIIPWLIRYSRMLEDRVRANWAARSFLWFVSVPTARVDEKAEEYSSPPEPGSVIVHDTAEEWTVQTPNLGASDAQHDLRAIRQAIAAGSGQPPHWHGDGGDINRANAEAMTDPATRHLRRRQKHLQFVIASICHHAYTRAYDLGKVRRAPDSRLITVPVPDISRDDNSTLAMSAQHLMAAFANLNRSLTKSTTLNRAMIDSAFQFAGAALNPETLDTIMQELGPTQENAPDGLPT